jgi:hypothetical protein
MPFLGIRAYTQRMTPGRISAVSAVVAFASIAGLQASPSQTPQKPDFQVQIWGDAAQTFIARMNAYAQLRGNLEAGLKALAVTEKPVEIVQAENALAARIRVARAKAKRGDIFSRRVRAAFRTALRAESDAGTCAAIRDDNPGDFEYRINGTYPKREPLSTVPPNMLAALPELPADVHYRFLGRDLVLHDTRANIILDEIPDAIRCVGR